VIPSALPLFPVLGILNERFPNSTNDAHASRGFIEFSQQLQLALKLLVFHQNTHQ
jgi:hypothetical protein